MVEKPIDMVEGTSSIKTLLYWPTRAPQARRQVIGLLNNTRKEAAAFITKVTKNNKVLICNLPTGEEILVTTIKFADKKEIVVHCVKRGDTVVARLMTKPLFKKNHDSQEAEEIIIKDGNKIYPNGKPLAAQVREENTLPTVEGMNRAQPNTRMKYWKDWLVTWWEGKTSSFPPPLKIKLNNDGQIPLCKTSSKGIFLTPGKQYANLPIEIHFQQDEGSKRLFVVIRRKRIQLSYLLVNRGTILERPVKEREAEPINQSFSGFNTNDFVVRAAGR